jgi:hypothetical protein
LIIEVELVGNSCHSFLCDVEVVDDEILNLIVTGYGSNYCASAGYHTIEFKFSVENLDSKDLIKSIMVNGNIQSPVLFNRD